MIKVTITTESGFVFWNKKQVKDRDVEELKDAIHKELLETCSQVKGVEVSLEYEDGVSELFNFDEEIWEDNNINFKKQADLVRGVIANPVALTGAEIFKLNFLAVDKSRANAYRVEVDPLLSEARIKTLLGDVLMATEYETRALQLRLQIQEANPYPLAGV